MPEPSLFDESSFTEEPQYTGEPSFPAEPPFIEDTEEPSYTEEPSLFDDQEEYLEPVLFDESEGGMPAEPGRSDEETILALEKELLRADVRADLGRTGVLLHPDFTEIGSSGRFWTRDDTMMSLEQNPAETVEIESLGSDRIGENTILFNYRSYGRSGTVLRTSLWVRDGGQWRLRFHQGTPET
jgi:ribonuclease HI